MPTSFTRNSPGSCFPDAFAGTMGQLLIALESSPPPSLPARDNLKSLALVEASIMSARKHRAISPS